MVKALQITKRLRAEMVKSLTVADLNESLVTEWAKSKGLALGRPAVPVPTPKEVRVGEFLAVVEVPKWPTTWRVAGDDEDQPEAAAVILSRLLERNEALLALGKRPYMRIEADSNAKNRARLRLFVLE